MRESVDESSVRGTSLAKRGQRARSIVVGIASLRRPALRIDRHEAGPVVDGHAKARAEVFHLLVAKVTNDLDGRPLGRRRASAPGRVVEARQQGVEHARESRELGQGAGQDVLRIVHVLTPPSSALYSPRSITR